MSICDPATLLEPSRQQDLAFKARVVVAGSIWDISSNSWELLRVFQTLFPAADEKESLASLSVRLQVDFSAEDVPRWGQPYFRALDHLYYGSFGCGDSLLADQLNRRVLGSFLAATVGDIMFWKAVFVPILMGIASASLAVTPLHCGCVTTKGHGLLLAGESGAGKSTLALFLSLNGFSYLADDCVYLSGTGQEMRAWGLPSRIKLLPEAVSYFPRLQGLEPLVSLNGELAFEVDPVMAFGVERSLSCEPRWLVSLERTKGSNANAEFDRISSREMATRLAADLEQLPSCLAGQYKHQLAMIDSLVERECWILRHSMEPALLTPLLAEFCGL